MQKYSLYVILFFLSLVIANGAHCAHNDDVPEPFGKFPRNKFTRYVCQNHNEELLSALQLCFQGPRGSESAEQKAQRERQEAERQRQQEELKRQQRELKMEQKIIERELRFARAKEQSMRADAERERQNSMLPKREQVKNIIKGLNSMPRQFGKFDPFNTEELNQILAVIDIYVGVQQPKQEANAASTKINPIYHEFGFGLACTILHATPDTRSTYAETERMVTLAFNDLRSERLKAWNDKHVYTGSKQPEINDEASRAWAALCKEIMDRARTEPFVDVHKVRAQQVKELEEERLAEEEEQRVNALISHRLRQLSRRLPFVLSAKDDVNLPQPFNYENIIKQLPTECYNPNNKFTRRDARQTIDTRQGPKILCQKSTRVVPPKIVSDRLTIDPSTMGLVQPVTLVAEQPLVPMAAAAAAASPTGF